jgi:hypothetical protein
MMPNTYLDVWDANGIHERVSMEAGVSSFLERIQFMQEVHINAKMYVSIFI